MRNVYINREKYLEEEPFTKEEISNALRQGVTDGSLIPVLCGTDRIGISIILNSMCFRSSMKNRLGKC